MQGKPPDFVLEIASPTGRNDYTGKRDDYAVYGAPEYWRFDSYGGRSHDTALPGDRLIDGVYRPISIVQVDEKRYWGLSEVLSSYLRWYDPAARGYLRTFDAD